MIRIFRKLHTKFIALALVISFIIPASFIALPEKAEAQVASLSRCLPSFMGALGITLGKEAAAAAVAVPVAPIGQIYKDSIQAGRDQSSFLRDCVEHGLALSIAKFMLAQMTQQIVDWINGGFNGSPAFVGNPGKFLTGIGDQIAGELILGSDLAFLCSPFKLQIQISLALNYSSSFSNRASCTLSDVVNNIDNFVNDFSEGGWAGWFAMTQSHNNNPYGSYLEARGQMEARIAGAQNIKLLELNWGSGFLSWEKCEETSLGSDCQIVTPGKVIGDTLQNQLDIPAEQLGLADDLDKIFNALGNQLMQQLLTKGLGALSGKSSNGGGSNSSSFLDDYVASAQTNQQKAQQNFDSNVSKIDQATSGAGTDVSVVGDQRNVALNKTVAMSSILTNSPDKLVNGDKSDSFDDTYLGAITRNQLNPWMQINLDKLQPIDRIVIHQRTNPSSASTQLNFHVEILDRDQNLVWRSNTLRQNFGSAIDLDIPSNTSGQYVKLQGEGTGRLEIAEVEVFANNPPAITLIGAPVMTVNLGSTFTDPGATAEDEREGDITARMTKTGLVDTSREGTYTITYSVTDESGAKAEKQRQVIVVRQQ